MLVEDLIVEVRDPSLERIGQIIPEDLVGATFVVRYNNVGVWSLTLPFGNRLGELLRLPGYGIVVTASDGTTIISGPTITAKLEQTQDNIQGNWLIEGASDDIVLTERLAYPTPATADVTAQTQPYDLRSGAVETVIKEYVDANIGPSAPAERQISSLVIGTDEARGSVAYASARFDNLHTLIYDLAQVANLGFKIEQDDSDLVFDVYEPTDRSATIRMDVQNQKLSSATYSYGQAKVTRAIVAGQGEAEQRIFIERTSADSLAAEGAWGRRIELFTDRRDTPEIDVLETAGDEVLADKGKTIVEMSVTPSDDQTMVYNKDWFLGDKVTIVANEIEATAIVTEVGIQIGSDGVRVGATVGTPMGITFEAKLLAKQENHENRISHLERSTTGYGINTTYQPQGGTDGTQPTFSGPAIFGSFNRFGNLVHFSIIVDFDNITSFGTGQYFLTLPFPARVAYQFRDGCLHDFSSGAEYQISGHVFANDDVLWLNFADKVASGVQDVSFTATNPITLTTADSFHIAGTYEIEG